MATLEHKWLIAMLAALALLLGPRARGQETQSIYLPKEGATPTQLRAHLERLQRAPPATRMQAGFREAMVATADKILEANPSESLRAFAVVALMDALHELAEQSSGSAEADQRLAELAEQHAQDTDRKVASTAAFYGIEQRALKVEQLSPEEAQALLEEIKIALRGKPLGAKHMRIANATPNVINRLADEKEAVRRFQEFGRIYAASRYPELGRLGVQIKAMQYTPPVPGESGVAEGSMPAAESTAMPASEAPGSGETVSEATLSEAPVEAPTADVPQAAPAAAETPAADSAAKKAALEWVGKNMELEGRTTAGDRFAFDNLKGKVVLVCFWSSETNSAWTTLSQIRGLYDQHHGQGLEVIGVNFDKNPQAASMVISQLEIPWANLVGETTNDKITAFLGALRKPEVATATFLVDRDGKIVASTLDPDTLEEQTKKLLTADVAPDSAKPE